MRRRSISLVNASAAPVAQPAEVHEHTEWGRKAILCGCVMVLVGMITYCYGSLDGGPESDLTSTLFQNGILGWISFVLLLTGVGVWISGNLVLLDEARSAEDER